jgi:membrane-bound lytic murein transglycosylase A
MLFSFKCIPIYFVSIKYPIQDSLLNMKRTAHYTLLVLLTLLVMACTKGLKPVAIHAPPQTKCDCPTVDIPVQVPASSKPAEVTAEQQKQLAKLADYSLLQTADWSDIDGLQVVNLSLASPA